MPVTIKSTLRLGLGFLFLIIPLLSGVGGYFLYQLSRNAEATLKDNYRSVAYAQQLGDALADLRDARLTAPAAVSAEVDQAHQAFGRALAAEQRNITGPDEGALADSVAAGFGRYLGAAPGTAATRATYQQLRRQITRVAALNRRAIEQQSRRTRRMATRTISTLGLQAALGILATFSFIFSFSDYLTKPVEELTAGTRRLGAGDYSQRLPTPVHHEFTEVAQAVNDMARKLDGYETAEGTPRIDSSGSLDLVTLHHRPGPRPAGPAQAPPAAKAHRAGAAKRGAGRQRQSSAGPRYF